MQVDASLPSAGAAAPAASADFSTPDMSASAGASAPAVGVDASLPSLGATAEAPAASYGGNAEKPTSKGKFSGLFRRKRKGSVDADASAGLPGVSAALGGVAASLPGPHLPLSLHPPPLPVSLQRHRGRCTGHHCGANCGGGV